MKNKFNTFIILFIILNLLCFTPVYVKSEEFENVDNFLIHPENRWENELSEATTTESLAYGNFYVYDGNGNTGESTLYTRPTSKNDFKLEGRLRTPIHDSAGDSDVVCRSFFGLHNYSDSMVDTDDMQVAIVFFMNDANYDDGTTDIYFQYIEGSTSPFTTKRYLYVGTVDGAIYVRCSIDIDVEEAELSFKITYDNGTLISEKDYWEIYTGDTTPRIFQNQALKVCFGHYFNDDGAVNIILQSAYDYIKAPFEEFEFKAQGGYGQGSALSSNEYGLVSDTSISLQSYSYYLTVPSFDSVSGLLAINVNDTSESAIDGNSAFVGIRIYEVNANSGSLNRIGWLSLGFLPRDIGGSSSSTYADARIRVGSTDSWYTPDYMEQVDSSSFQQTVEAGFCIYKPPNKDYLIFKTVVNGITREMTYNTSYITNEYVVESFYLVSGIDGSDESLYQLSIKEFEASYRDLLGFLPDLPSVDDVIGGIFNLFLTPMIQGFRMIGGFIATIISPITDLIGNLISPVTSLLSTVVGFSDEIISLASDLGTIVSDFISNVESAITSTIGGVIDTISTAVANIYTALQNIATTIVNKVIELAFDVLNAIYDVLASAFDSIWNIIDGFFIWVYDNIFAGIFGVITDIVDRVIFGLTITFNWIRTILTFTITYPFAVYMLFSFILWVIYGTSGADDVIDGLKNMMEVFSKDATGGTTLFTFRLKIPLGFVWFALTFFFWGLLYFT